MVKPTAANMPGMTDTLDFVKNLWGSMNLPGTNLSGMAAPPMSVEDLDKRIADLKAVESWLNMNLSMLHGTIQAMEVQRSTLSTLKAMGASMAEVMRQSGVSAEKMAGMPFASFFGQPAGGSAAPAGGSPADGGAAGAAGLTGAAGASAGASAAADGGSAQPGTSAPAQDPASAAAAMGMPAAMAWWNMLQEQFTQAVSAAMTPADGTTRAESPGEAPPPAQASAAAPAAEAPGAAAPPNGNGRARGGKPKTDKT